MAYKTLEQQIQELWTSRGFVEIEEEFKAVDKKKKVYRWTITARSTSEIS